MKTLLACSVVVATLMSVASFANPPAGVGGGQGHGNSGFGSAGGEIPPGLQNKGTPPGLQMHNKTPYGWGQGRKEGWKSKRHGSFKHKHQIHND
jgi:hypothetical protein